MWGRKEKALTGVFSAGFRLADALDIAADVYHGVSITKLACDGKPFLTLTSLSSGQS
jgi:hypothetical protein